LGPTPAIQLAAQFEKIGGQTLRVRQTANRFQLAKTLPAKIRRRTHASRRNTTVETSLFPKKATRFLVACGAPTGSHMKTVWYPTRCTPPEQAIENIGTA
jgi:hypothetical protein